MNNPLYVRFTGRHRDDYATLDDLMKNYKLNVPDDFNFAFDCLDVLAGETPGREALVWVHRNGLRWPSGGSATV